METLKPFAQTGDLNLLIEADRLTKKFDGVTALDEISFDVRQGEVFGFLGPNGAGKTTTINILAGLARRDSGTFRVGGVDCTRRPKTAQHLIGTVPDESNLYPELSVFDNLCFCAALYGMHKDERRKGAQDLLKTFDLTEAAGRKFAGYSKGMKRKLTGVANPFVQVVLALFLADLSQVAWTVVWAAVVMIAIASTFLGLFIAVSVSEVFEAQTFSNFFRFPMIFLCGLFFPIKAFPIFLQPLSYLLPLTRRRYSPRCN